MIAFHGRLAFKQYTKGKTNPWDIKVWCAAEADSGYLLNFSIYSGKVNEPLPNGMGYHFIRQLGASFLGKYHHFVYYSYFSSVPLAEDLLRENTYCCSTVRTNRKGFPSDYSTEAGRRMQKGDVKFRQRGNLVALGWTGRTSVV